MHLRRLAEGRERGHFIHCNLASGRAWMPLARALGDRVTVDAVDMLGQGRSRMPDRSRDYQVECAEGSIAIMEQTGPQHLVGHSFGGCVAIRVAMTRPDLVRSLVLYEPVFFGFLADTGHPGLAKITAGPDLYGLMDAGHWMDAAEVFLTEWGMPGDWAAMDADARQSMADKMWLIQVQRPSILDDNDWRVRARELARLTLPVMVMHGAASSPVMADITEVIVKSAPAAQGNAMAGLGHMGPITDPGPVAAAMVAFWDGVAQAAA
ncbi:MAG: alpha/beta fold hydrolase [Pseudomonadota bacterium]